MSPSVVDTVLCNLRLRPHHIPEVDTTEFLLRLSASLSAENAYLQITFTIVKLIGSY